MAFEVFDKRKSALGKAPSATLQKKGLLSLNSSAHRMLNFAGSVELLFDPESQVIALKPSDEAHAYAFRTASKNTGQVVVSLTAFTEYYGIDTTVSKRIIPRLEGELLCLDLNEGVPIVGNRGKAAAQKDE
ncbi:Hypothetical protein CGLY_16740 (plasmid) [Corynebacterium glyciniphilum AJ 3170]|uniref:Uncharacterized protein n=1 Tax=Corynebacterium glyciniphilum AJ 3170 TaxID=1404245 RepID=X5EGL9_9CORY|nr:Hypothetical protein CGLY_16740 [Corynebacterium glyciniphilum AJ 3170]